MDIIEYNPRQLRKRVVLGAAAFQYLVALLIDKRHKPLWKNYTQRLTD
jgi:hypothetical protein